MTKDSSSSDGALLYQRHYENTPAMMHSIDRQGRLLCVSDAWLRKLGYERAEVIGRPSTDFLTQESCEKARLIVLPSFFETGAVNDVEYQMVCRDGTVIDVLLSAVAEWDSTGQISRSMAVIQDVTKRKATEQALRSKEAMLQRAEVIAGVGRFCLDLRTGQQTWTPQVFRIYEMENTDAPSLANLMALVPPESRAYFNDAMTASLQGGTYDSEILMRTAKGRPIWIRTAGEVELEGGVPVRLVGAVQDITDRKRFEEELRRANERFELAAVAAGIGVWEWNVIDDTLHWDDEMYRLYRRLSSEGLTPYALWRASVHPEDRVQVEHAFSRALSRTAVFKTQYRILLADGDVRHMKIAARVLHDAGGRPLRMVGVNFDVTELKLAELALTESEAKYRSLFELAPVGIALNDLQSGRFLHLNEAMASPTGYSREELLDLTYWDITSSQFITDEREQIETMSQTNRYGPYEKEYVRKDGSTYPVMLSGIKVTDESGRPMVWSIIQDISARKAMEMQLTDAARRDKLTGLANRALFMERLERAIARVRGGTQPFYAVLFLDFDRFKLVNDTLGHEAGDDLLREIAGRLAMSLRASDALAGEECGNVVSRFGGDEFLVLLNDLSTADEATRVAERLLNALSSAYDIQGREVHSSASIGIVTSEHCSSSADEAVRDADLAMYEAKRAGRACSVVFHERMQARLTRHVAIETSLRRAIGSNELFLVYQPIVELSTGRIVSAEALLRWQHPVLGTVTPAEFIPVAEESGLIVSLGQWVQKEACETMAAWRKQDLQSSPKTLSVNVSRAELTLGARFLDQVRSVLDRAGLPPECLQLEVTEREVMRNPESCRALMRQLQHLGVQIAMDDFGTGTSSLGVLRDYPFNTIKIDQCFVRDLNSGNADVIALVHATVNLIENLGMASLAEGVEDLRQIAILQSLGCRYAQGYFFGRPVLGKDFLDCARTVSRSDINVSV